MYTFREGYQVCKSRSTFAKPMLLRGDKISVRKGEFFSDNRVKNLSNDAIFTNWAIVLNNILITRFKDGSDI
jgi:hypothetical protein